MKTLAIRLVVTVILLSMLACGFKLRGQISSLPFESLYISAPSGSSIGSDLERAIAAGTTTRVVYKQEEAEAMLQVIRSTNERRILSLSGGGRVREFQLIYQLTTRLVDNKGEKITSDNDIILTSILPFLNVQILAKQAEEKLLFENMQADAVQQLIWRLATLKLKK